MLADDVRVRAYTESLRTSVQRDSVVLELGCGTGYFSLLACRFGARKVYAIEPNPAIEIARETAQRNGLGSRIEFIKDVSLNVELPEKVDVLVSDLRGVLPHYRKHIVSIIDARRRMLSASGVQIPFRDVLRVSAVEKPELRDALLSVWERQPLGLDLSPASQAILSQFGSDDAMESEGIKLQDLLSTPVVLQEIDYETVATPNLAAKTTLPIERDGDLSGICIWFDAILTPNVSFSNAPGSPSTVYRRAFFPIPHSLEVQKDDQVTFEVHANLVGDDYAWQWNTSVLRGKSMTASFQQSTFDGVPMSLKELKLRSGNHVPQLNQEGRIRLLALTKMNEGLSLHETANSLFMEFPERFSSLAESHGFVGDLSVKYSSIKNVRAA